MTEIRDKDRLFLAVVVPALAIAAYIWLWRADAARKVAELEIRSASLVTNEDFAGAKALADRALKAAEEELASEKSAPPPATTVKGDPDATAAERESAVLSVFREAGLWVVRSEDVGGGAAGDKLRATGTCREPRCRRYVLDGSYPAVRRALDAFVVREMAVVPERLEMREAGVARWTMEVWE